MHIYGHRGARNECPENTLPSFKHAYANGVRFFELDIQLTQDKELAVIHDTSTDRTTGQRGRVRELKLSELKDMDARCNTPYWPNPAPIPSLQEVVEACPEVEHWQFEVKPDAPADLHITAELLTLFILEGNLVQKATITSSSAKFLRIVKKLKPEISTGLVFEKSLRNSVKRASDLGCEYLILHWPLCSRKVVSQADSVGIKVSCWTVNRIDDMKKLQGMGVHSIITDYPTSALIYFNNYGNKINA